MAQSPREPTALPRFNVFRALRLDAHEIRHSNFLGWVLDPSESHGQADLFLRLFLDLLAARMDGLAPAGTPGELAGADVSREHDQLDLRIVIPNRHLVIGIENKVFTKEHSGQLTRYATAVARDFPGWRHALLYLTLAGDEPSDKRWQSLSHREVHRVITTGVEQLIPGTPQEIRSFIQHYLDLLADVYQRRAFAAETPRSPEVMETIASAVRDRPGWRLVSRSSSLIECGPTSLFAALPGLCAKRGRDPREWLTLRFHDHGARGYVGRYWRPSVVTNMPVRNRVLRALVEKGDASGFKYKLGSLEDAFGKAKPAFSGDRIQDARTGKVPSLPLLRDLINRELAAVEARLPEILRIVSEAARE